MLFRGPMIRRRRPLLGAAMLGGTAYAAHKAGQRSAEAQMAEQTQDARLAELEAQQAPAYAPAPAQAPAHVDVVGKLTELKGLLDGGALTREEFDAAKRKLLGT